MRDYGKVAASFWTGMTGKSLRGNRDAQIVALYLMTCPSSTMTGLYYMPLPSLCHETGIPIEGASEALRCLSEAHFAYYDADSEIVWVPEMARWQIGESMDPRDKRIAGVVRLLEPYQKSKFYRDFFEKYSKEYHLPKLLQTKGLRRGMQGASKPHRSQEQEQEQYSGTETGAGNTPPTPHGGELPGFDDFWIRYPRKEGKQAALRAWQKLSPSEQLAVQLIEAVEVQRTWPSWTKDGGQFIPHASTWLNGRRWEDQPPTVREKSMRDRIAAEADPSAARLPAKEVQACSVTNGSSIGQTNIPACSTSLPLRRPG